MRPAVDAVPDSGTETSTLNVRVCGSAAEATRVTMQVYVLSAIAMCSSPVIPTRKFLRQTCRNAERHPQRVGSRYSCCQLPRRRHVTDLHIQFDQRAA